MTFSPITDALYTKVDQKLTHHSEYDKNFLNSKTTSYKDISFSGKMKRQVASRLSHFTLILPSFTTSVADATLGLFIFTPLNLITIGAIPRLHNKTLSHTKCFNTIFSNPLANLLKSINPRAQINTDHTHGFSTYYLKVTLINHAHLMSGSKNKLTAHISSRFTYALLGIACVATRIFDAMIAIPAAFLAILTLGYFEKLNNVAYRAFQFPGLVDDEIYCLTKFLNPWANTHLPESPPAAPSHTPSPQKSLHGFNVKKTTAGTFYIEPT